LHKLLKYVLTGASSVPGNTAGSVEIERAACERALARTLGEVCSVADGRVGVILITPVSLIHGIHQLSEAPSENADHFLAIKYQLCIDEKSDLL
jgi:hypothetical protein